MKRSELKLKHGMPADFKSSVYNAIGEITAEMAGIKFNREWSEATNDLGIPGMTDQELADILYGQACELQTLGQIPDDRGDMVVDLVKEMARRLGLKQVLGVKFSRDDGHLLIAPDGMVDL